MTDLSLGCASLSIPLTKFDRIHAYSVFRIFRPTWFTLVCRWHHSC